MRLLFERLAVEAGPTDPVNAVLNNVQRLVSTRSTAGGYLARQEQPEPVDTAYFDLFSCGVPDIVEVALGDRHRLERYGAHVQALIAHYEPRLRNPRVGLEGGRVVISGAIDTAEGLHFLRFPVELREDG